MPARLAALVCLVALVALVGGLGGADATPMHQAPAPRDGASGTLEPALPGAIPPTLLAARRRALAAAVGEAVVVVEARGGPEGDPVSRDFLYLTGVETPTAVLLIDCREGRARSTLFLPPHDRGYERWHGPRLAPGEVASAHTAIADTQPLDAFDATFTEVTRRAAERGAELLHSAVPDAGRVVPTLDLPSVEEAWVEAMRERFPGLSRIAAVAPAVARLRQVKDAEELARLRRAVAITEAGFESAFATIAPGTTEFALESAIEATFRRLGARGPGYDSIIGAGDRSCILHYHRNDGPVAAGDLVVIDVGASWGGYTADVTRTLPADGLYTERQREVFELVARAQAAGIAAARPGATIRDVHRAARGVFEEAGVAHAFLHGTSHHVGLDVHDPGPLRRPFEAGMLITVEPGLYFLDESLGLRLEDMILITAEDPVILSKEIPRTPAAIEAAIERARGATGENRENPPSPRRTAL